MSQASKLSWNSPPNEKNHCCEAMLLSLLQRIKELEGKLELEVERRQNDFNDILRLVVKDKVQTRSNKTLQSILPFKASKSKLKASNDKSPKANNKKQSLKNLFNKRASIRLTASSKMIFQSQQKHEIQSNSNDTLKAIQCRTKSVEDHLSQHQAELDKMKELTDYLMDQFLIIFQKIKPLQMRQESPLKEITSLETVTSMLIEGQAKKKHIQLISEQDSGIRHTDLGQMEFRDLKQKVAQHETILSDLIQITRQVSAQVGRIPIEPRFSKIAQI